MKKDYIIINIEPVKYWSNITYNVYIKNNVAVEIIFKCE